MLLTLNVPFDPEAAEMAIATAAETGAELWICDAMAIAANYIGHAARSYAEQDNRRHLDATARQARERGVRVQQVAFHNPKPVRAAIEVAHQHEIGLLVFGPDRRRLSRLTYRRAVKRLRDDAGCLVWVNA
jgi:hypothetical protein